MRQVRALGLLPAPWVESTGRHLAVRRSRGHWQKSRGSVSTRMSALPSAVFDPDLTAWLAEHRYGDALVDPLPGDVSARRYFRLRHTSSVAAILAVYPSTIREVCTRFERTTKLLENVKVPVPALLASDPERGWMLLADVGERTLYQHAGRPWSELEILFDQAIEILGRIRGLPIETAATLNPPLDATLLRRELEKTTESFLRPRGFLRDAVASHAVELALDALCSELGAARPVVCHRDFMARNLVPELICSEGSSEWQLWVLDHQDLRLGPPEYDLASLLNDSLFPPPEVESRLLVRAAVRDATAFHRAAAQRTLKAVGTYATFAARGNTMHLPLIGPTFARALHHLEKTPEGSAAADHLRSGLENSFC